MARQCAYGLHFLHSNQIMHRDVKSMNVLVTDDFSCKLSDFGTAKVLTKNPLHTVVGSPLWMAAEVKDGKNYSFPADCYSLGLVLYEIFSGKLPEFDQQTQLAVLPSSGFPFRISLIEPCVKSKPEERYKSNDIVDQINQHVEVLVKKVTSLKEWKEAKPADRSLELVYRFLLALPASESDAIVDRAFNPPKQ